MHANMTMSYNSPNGYSSSHRKIPTQHHSSSGDSNLGIDADGLYNNNFFTALNTITAASANPPFAAAKPLSPRTDDRDRMPVRLRD